ncbi:MAG: serine protein kinase RIO [Candidatus Hodarchaeota archaeon]
MKPDDKKIWEKIDRKDDHWRKRRKKTEDFQTVDSVIDLSTVKQLKRLQEKGFIDSITGTIASGKESGVFLAKLGPEGEEYCKSLSIASPIVIKIFRTSTLNFKKIIRYIDGDIRFRKRSKRTRHIINLWAEKEYKNLQRSSIAKIKVPKPILVKNNIILMELLGENSQPFPLLKNSPNAFTEAILNQIINQTKLLFQQAGLVHADLSPFNILIGNKIPYFIDMSQSVLISHPRALEFLKRDLNNVLSFFLTQEFNIPDRRDLFDIITKDFPKIDFID